MTLSHDHDLDTGFSGDMGPVPVHSDNRNRFSDAQCETCPIAEGQAPRSRGFSQSSSRVGQCLVK